MNTTSEPSNIDMIKKLMAENAPMFVIIPYLNGADVDGDIMTDTNTGSVYYVNVKKHIIEEMKEATTANAPFWSYYILGMYRGKEELAKYENTDH